MKAGSSCRVSSMPEEPSVNNDLRRGRPSTAKRRATGADENQRERYAPSSAERKSAGIAVGRPAASMETSAVCAVASRVPDSALEIR